jgi:hypothetical protein
MAVYRFLASVKLAVITISLLAASLALATWVEKNHGAKAGQEVVYESTAFALLLAFLATNILCAATIRFPWKKRQTGFVVTHAGLLVLIFGSWFGFHYSDEGTTAAIEGGKMDSMVLPRHPVIRLRDVDARTGKPGGEYELTFHGGAFAWPAGKRELISKPKDPFKVEVVSYLASAAPTTVHVEGKPGTPMLRLSARAKPPRSEGFIDVFANPEDGWLAIPEGSMGFRKARRAGAAKFAFIYVDRPEMVEDFLNPPKAPGDLGVVRFRYEGTRGRPLVHEIRLDDLKPDQSFPLPGSDLTVTFVEAFRTRTERLAEKLGDDEISLVKFKVRKGEGPQIDHLAPAGLPMAPPVVTGADGERKAPLVQLSFFQPPLLGSSGGPMSGTFGVVEVLGDDKGRLFYRVFSRDDSPAPPQEAGTSRPGKLKKPPAPIKLGERVVAFGGGPNTPMTLEFAAEDYLQSGQEKEVYVHRELPEGKKDEGQAAALLRLTKGDETREVWVPQTEGINGSYYVPVRFDGATYQLAFDVERKNLGFSLTVLDADTGFYPGTTSAMKYSSDVLINDREAGIVDRPYKIEMNQPLTHGKYTFYQSQMVEVRDPQTNRRTGEAQTVLHVGHDAGRGLKYLGCVLVVLGTFLQFYMRAGVATLFAKSAPESSADAARRRLAEKAAAKLAKAKQDSTKHDDEIL